MLTCGPWRPIYLEVFTARLEDLWFKIDLSNSLSNATVLAHAEIVAFTPLHTVEFELLGPDGILVEARTENANKISVATTFELNSPQLWFPAGTGPQKFYTLNAKVLNHAGAVLCTSSKKLGIRSVELIQKPLKSRPGTTFFFQVNKVPIFARGSNWIPADMFLPRVTSNKYRTLVQLVADGYQNIIRVWGGGIYEDDAFYDACDEFGILVWQDFMLACGSVSVHALPLMPDTGEVPVCYRALPSPHIYGASVSRAAQHAPISAAMYSLRDKLAVGATL